MRKKTLITISFFLAFQATRILNSTLFIANTPRINPLFISYIKLKIEDDRYHLSWNEYRRLRNPIIKVKVDKGKLARLILRATKNIAPGVYAGGEGKTRVVYFKLSEMINKKRVQKFEK